MDSELPDEEFTRYGIQNEERAVKVYLTKKKYPSKRQLAHKSAKMKEILMAFHFTINCADFRTDVIEKLIVRFSLLILSKDGRSVDIGDAWGQGTRGKRDKGKAREESPEITHN